MLTNLGKLILATVLLLGLLVVLAHAQSTPTNCTFPTAFDTWNTFRPGDAVPSSYFNKLECVADKLARRAVLTARQEKLCSSPTAVGASTRLSVVLTAASSFTGAETVLPQPPLDATSPPAVEVDGIDPPAGAAVRVWLFNRDADRSRTVTLCASVVRP